MAIQEEKQNLLVTWDYTGVSEYALQHAIRIARNVQADIELIHVIEAAEAKKSLTSHENQLKEAMQRMEEKYDYPLGFKLLVGSIFTAISKYASDSGAVMALMGTHGMKGMQKVMGSWALRVIVGSSIPFIIVQDRPENNERIKSIVFPIDFKSENKEKLQWAIYMGKYFNSRVYLFKAPVMDKSLVKKTNVNLNFAIRFLIQNNMDYEIHTGKRSSKFAKETIAFAQKKKADMILITTTKNITFANYVLGAQEQYIISNSSKIPVMCVNPRATFAQVGQFMYGST